MVAVISTAAVGQRTSEATRPVAAHADSDDDGELDDEEEDALENVCLTPGAWG